MRTNLATIRTTALGISNYTAIKRSGAAQRERKTTIQSQRNLGNQDVASDMPLTY